MSNCEHDLLTECFESLSFPLATDVHLLTPSIGFRTVLSNPGRIPTETIIRWADHCFERICTSPDAQRRSAPRSLLVRWSFVSSQIIRDLTLRCVEPSPRRRIAAHVVVPRSSAPSFGSFQILALFLEDFLSFQVSSFQIFPATVLTACPSTRSFDESHCKCLLSLPRSKLPTTRTSTSSTRLCPQ